jgi:ATP-binding cassette subfamily G (WHITE) protein 2 (SNQ2)
LAVNGDVLYAGQDAALFKKRYKGQVVYNQEDDLRKYMEQTSLAVLPTDKATSRFFEDHATLTVAQTLDFALRTKTPGKRLPAQTRQDFRRAVLELLLRMLNISHTVNTLVGNEFVRGVSGGERKRVSIAEMMTTGAVVAAWDNSTRGLDASTALDYAKSLRILSDLFNITQFVSLYQAGEGIYDQFDKVLVIDSGRMVFFGPAKVARQYFIDLGFRDLPRQTTADYLTGCTDPNERR